MTGGGCRVGVPTYAACQEAQRAATGGLKACRELGHAAQRVLRQLRLAGGAASAASRPAAAAQLLRAWHPPRGPRPLPSLSLIYLPAPLWRRIHGLASNARQPYRLLPRPSPRALHAALGILQPCPAPTPSPPPPPSRTQVYNVHTNSNNNTWLRRKLLEAVGASRRFYAAANRTGRPKQRRAHADAGHAGAAAAAAAKPRAAPRAAQAVQHCAQRGAAVHPHHTVAPGPALPAGSPRALAARRRAATAGSATGLADAVHGAHLPPRHHYLLGSGTRFAPSQLSSEDGEACSEGSEVHPRALAPRAQLDAGPPSCSGTPTSACVAAQPPPYSSMYAPPPPAAIPCNG